MATKTHIGIDGVSRKVKTAFIGADNVARKVKKIYIGDENGKARLCFTSHICSYGTPKYSWNPYHTSCTASATCTCGNAVTETSSASQNTYIAGTCTEKEKWDCRVYFSNPLFSSQTCPDWHEGSTDSSNHSGTASVEGYTKIGDYVATHTVNYKYSCCGATYSVSEGCDNKVERVTKQPTCTDNGETRVYCSKCGAENGFVDVPAATGHKFPQTYTDFGNRWHAKLCTVCGEYYNYHYSGGSGECDICNK